MQKYNYPTAFVIFGGTGDLAQTKLLPALLDLYMHDTLPEKFVVIGLSRKEMSDETYQQFVKESIDAKGHNHDERTVAEFCSHMRYVSGSFEEAQSYKKIKVALQAYDDSIAQCTNKLFYLAVPPDFYSEIFSKLKENNVMELCDGIGSWARLLVEKPFGRDLKTAQVLEQQLCELFSEEQIYRIDHYLAKDAIENIISLRFANSILANSWSSGKIESIAVRLLETKDVSTRGSFYDGIGALRDVGQNHMLQILALLTMHNVDVNDVSSVRKGRAEALRALLHQEPKKIVRAQYKGYLETEGVNPSSETETYFKIETEIDTDAWRGVRISLEAGKALNEAVTEAVITFRAVDMCGCDVEEKEHEHKNILHITFSPEQLISLKMWVKKPGFDFTLEERELVLAKADVEDRHSPEAYERVLYDCITGDQTRFVSGDEEMASWEFITPILEKIATLPLLTYEQGSAGPTIDK